MTSVQQVKKAVLTRLQEEGMQAVGAYAKEQFEKPQTALLVVGARRAEIKNAGLLDYLGRSTEESGEKEVYGREMKLSFSIDIYVPKQLGEAGCEEAAEHAAEALMQGLPSGLRIEEIVWEKTAWDRGYDLLLMPGSIRCTAYFLAKAEEETAEMTDFILKGVVSK